MSLEQIGPYLIQEEIATSGPGRLFLAVEPESNEQVALRLLPGDFLADQTFRAQFSAEMEALSACNHPGILPASILEIDGQDWLVRRWLPGSSLAGCLTLGALELNQALALLAQIAAALEAAHACGVLHQNLKPSNVLLDENGSIFLTDFGLGSGLAGNTGRALTWLYGAPASISPEAALGQAELDARSDVYGLGALAYELLSGQPPFPERRMLTAALQHLTAPPPNLAAQHPDLPLGVAQTITRAMAKDPIQRFASPGEFVSAMQWVLKNPRKSPPWLTSSLAAPSPRNRRVGLWLGLTVATILIAVGVLVGTGTLNQLLPGINLPTFNLPIKQIQANPTLPPASPAPIESDTPLPPTPLPSASSTPPATATSPPTATRTPIPTATSQPTEAIISMPLSMGGANLLAFVNANDIWTINLDGSNLTRLTEDEQPKIDLQWTPDGNALTYSSDGCYYLMIYATLQVQKLGCFEDLEISPDLHRFIIGGMVTLPNGNRSWMNFIGPLDYTFVSTLRDIPQRSTNGGTAFIGGRQNQFSSTTNLMAAVFKAPKDGRQIDQIQVFELTQGGEIDVIDYFPAERFTLRGYSGPQDQAVLDDFGWNGQELFALHGNVLHGYGDLVIYNKDTGRAKIFNPIAGKCCYQDIQFSPDGQYLLFAFQDNEIGQGAQIYLIPFGLIESGADFTPIELPYYFFADSRARVEPALRPEN